MGCFSLVIQDSLGKEADRPGCEIDLGKSQDVSGMPEYSSL